MIPILSSLLAIALVGWLTSSLKLRVLAYYMCTKDYAIPSEQEVEACTEFVIRNALGLTK